VVVNLVDNAAEAMQNSLVKELFIATRVNAGEAVELVVADTGCGVSSEDRERLFLPYFSTKGRGTGLGLAIVNHILSEHNATIRVEDNAPAGARFTVEIPVIVELDEPRSTRGTALDPLVARS
jgi:C4-dicarboxylate-specific signal transduction histidine kinase